MRGGKRAGAGRPVGSTDERTERRRAATAEKAKEIEAALGTDAFDGDAHALLMSVYRDTSQPMDVRVDAAKAAVPYEKPRLANVKHQGDSAEPVRHIFEWAKCES